jgi:class 3 adenylate cyclase
MLFCVVYFVSLSAQVSEKDSLLSLIRKAGNDSTKADLLVEVSSSLFSEYPEEAHKYALEAYQFADRSGNIKAKALAMKFAGLSNYRQGKMVDAFRDFNQSLDLFRSINDIVGEANILSNIGALFSDQGEEETALKNLLRSLALSEQVNDSKRIATAKINIGSIYMKKSYTYDKAIENFKQAMDLSKKINYSDAYAISLINLGETYFYKKQYDSALYFYSRIEDEIRDDDELLSNAYKTMGKIYLINNDFERAEFYSKRSYEMAKRSNLKLEMTKSLVSLGETYQAKKQNDEAIKYFTEARSIAEDLNLNYELKDIYEGFAKSYGEKGDFKNALAYQNLLNAIKDTIYNIETDKKLTNLQLDFEIDKKEGQIQLLTKDKALQEVELKRQRIAKNSAIVGLGMLLIIAFILYRNYQVKIKTNRILDKQKAEIETLLLNILPEEVARELQETGNATPKYYEKVSVLFTDFKSFSKLADHMSPQQVIEELNLYFTAFDSIIEKYNLEKIKTIGDAYMCAGGIPVADDSHLVNIIRASMEIQNYIEYMNLERRKAGKPEWEMRIGIHTGPLVAGVVGRKKYAYDIWGSTVNIANRMESNGEPGQVNISSATYELVKNQFACTYRGKISAKNIGEVDMYFVN